MRSKNIGAASEIGNSPRHAQNAMHRTRRKLQQVNRALQHPLIIRRKTTHRIRFRLIEMRIAAPRTMSLHFARTNHTRTNYFAGFTRRRIGSQFGGRQSRHFHMQIDTFEQRA
jgi:hypothetical protein